MVEKLTERITIQQQTETKQANGEVILSWSDVATVWADALPISGNEDFTGDKKTATQKYRFIIRHRTDIDTTNKIVWDGRDYDIEFINPYFKTGRNNYIEIKCSYAEAR